MSNKKIILEGAKTLDVKYPICGHKSLQVVLDGILLMEKCNRKWVIKQVDIINPVYIRYHCKKCKYEWTIAKQRYESNDQQ